MIGLRQGVMMYAKWGFRKKKIKGGLLFLRNHIESEACLTLDDT